MITIFDIACGAGGNLSFVKKEDRKKERQEKKTDRKKVSNDVMMAYVVTVLLKCMKLMN